MRPGAAVRRPQALHPGAGRGEAGPGDEPGGHRHRQPPVHQRGRGVRHRRLQRKTDAGPHRLPGGRGGREPHAGREGRDALQRDSFRHLHRPRGGQRGRDCRQRQSQGPERERGGAAHAPLRPLCGRERERKGLYQAGGGHQQKLPHWLPHGGQLRL